MGGPERVVIGEAELWWGDCRDVYAGFPKDAAIVSDVPYGIGFDFTKDRRNRQSGLRWGIGRDGTVPGRWTASVHGDDTPFDPLPWLPFAQVILWGANHYASRLPDSAAWLIWDKRDGATSDNHSDCELAWTNLPGPARIHRQLWRGIVRAGIDNVVHGPKLHPAQKPLELMCWCVAKTTGIVIDPFAGSFTTAVAALQCGRKVIACEIDRRYFDIGCRRVEDAYRQLALFPPPAPTPPATQLALLAKGRP